MVTRLRFRCARIQSFIEKLPKASTSQPVECAQGSDNYDTDSYVYQQILSSRIGTLFSTLIGTSNLTSESVVWP
jgi:hypothetical protein